MLNTAQIKQLKKGEYYGQTYSILNNIEYYSSVKINTISTFSMISKFSIGVTCVKVLCFILEFVKIKEFATFRNKIIEIFLNDDIMIKDIITQLESRKYKWLNVQAPDFREKISAIKGSTIDIYCSEDFICEIATILQKHNQVFDEKELGEIFNHLKDEYDYIYKAWSFCYQEEALSIKQLRKYYEGLKSSNKFSENTKQGELTGALNL